MPTAEERSASDAIVGTMLLLFGFGCIGFCVYYWAAASKRVKQRLQTAASKRLMKRGKEGDSQLYVTSTQGLQPGEQVSLGKETVSVESLGFAITISEGLPDACKSGDALIRVRELREAASESAAEAADQKAVLLKDVAKGDKEVLVTGALVVKKGERVKIGTLEQELVIKSVGKIVMVTPALKTTHAIGSKLRKAGEAEQTTGSTAEDADREETAAEETAGEETGAEELAEGTADEKPKEAGDAPKD